MLLDVMNYYLHYPEKMMVPAGMASFEQNPRGVCDFVSGMTDRYVVQAHAKLIQTPEFSRLQKIMCVFDEVGNLQGIAPDSFKSKVGKNKP